MWPSGKIIESVVAFSVKTFKPFTNDGWTGQKESGDGFDSDLPGLLDHLITPMFFIFTLSHNLVVFVRTHNFVQTSFQNPVRFFRSIMCPFLFD